MKFTGKYARAHPATACALLLLSAWLVWSAAGLEIAVDIGDHFLVKHADQVPPERRAAWPVTRVVDIGDGDERCNCPDTLDAQWIESAQAWSVDGLIYRHGKESDFGKDGAIATKMSLFDVQRAARRLVQNSVWARPQDCATVSREFNLRILSFMITDVLPDQIRRIPSDDPILRGDALDGPVSAHWDGFLLQRLCRSPNAPVNTHPHVCKAGEMLDIMQGRTSTQKRIREAARAKE